MLVLRMVSYIGGVLIFAFATLSLACGLYYLAELVEEYTVMTRKIIKNLTIAVAATHILLLLFDDFPFWQTVFSLMCHAVYSSNLATFPFINLTSPSFILSCVLVLVDHFIWFKFFTEHYFHFFHVAAFFGLCVWIVPFTFFISLSANDNALPSFDPNIPDSIPARNRSGMLKNVLNFVLQKSDTPFLPAASSYGLPTLVDRKQM